MSRYFFLGRRTDAAASERKRREGVLLIAHRGSRADDPDSVAMKSYHTQEEAYADLRKITTGYSSGAVCINLDTD